jgi:hypothetical protein
MDKGHNPEKCIRRDSFCSSEMKRDRRMMPRWKLFVLTRLQKHRPEPRKSVLGSSPNEDSFCNCS